MITQCVSPPSLGDLFMVMEGAALKLRPGATSQTLDDLHHDMVQNARMAALHLFDYL